MYKNIWNNAQTFIAEWNYDLASFWKERFWNSKMASSVLFLLF